MLEICFDWWSVQVKRDVGSYAIYRYDSHMLLERARTFVSSTFAPHIWGEPCYTLTDSNLGF